MAAFGAALHVAARDGDALQRALAPLGRRAELQIAPTSADLEDVFISLIASTPDNFGSASDRSRP